MPVDDVNRVDDVEAEPGGMAAPAMLYSTSTAFTSDAAFFLPADDYDVIRRLAGVDSEAFPDGMIQALPILPVALAEARRRVPATGKC